MAKGQGHFVILHISSHIAYMPIYRQYYASNAQSRTLHAITTMHEQNITILKTLIASSGPTRQLLHVYRTFMPKAKIQYKYTKKFNIRSHCNYFKNAGLYLQFLSLIKVSDLSRKPFYFRSVFSSLLFKVSDFSPKPFCFRSVFSSLLFFFIIKVSDLSRKPFCFRSVFSSLLFFFSFFLYHLVCSAITLSILNRFTSNFHNILIVNRRFDSYTF